MTADTPMPPVVPWKEISRRLDLIFPLGMNNRTWFVRDIAAKTIFVMLYTGAIAGTGRFVRPNQVTRMTDAQAMRTSRKAREEWRSESMRPHRGPTGPTWFAVDSREPIRDETLKNSLLAVGAVTRRTDVPTTSSLPIWALAEDFAALFWCPDEDLQGRIDAWRKRHLSAAAMARVELARRAVTAAAAAGSILVRFPNGETRSMSAGKSSAISQAVIEVFAPRFLTDPGVIWLSESGNKVVSRDDGVARAVRIDIDQQKVLPDIILVDLGAPVSPLFVFVEVVASDGPITTERKAALLELVTDGGHGPEHAAFVTAFMDRGAAEFRKTIGEIAPDTLAWCVSEPDLLIGVVNAAGRLTHLMSIFPPAATEDAP